MIRHLNIIVTYIRIRREIDRITKVSLYERGARWSLAISPVLLSSSTRQHFRDYVSNNRVRALKYIGKRTLWLSWWMIPIKTFHSWKIIHGINTAVLCVCILNSIYTHTKLHVTRVNCVSSFICHWHFIFSSLFLAPQQTKNHHE